MTETKDSTFSPRGLGYRIDDEPPCRPFLTGVPSPSSLPAMATTPYGIVLDQGNTQACTGFAAKVMLDAALASRGLPGSVSQRALYTQARYALFDANEPMQDMGAHFRAVFTKAMDFGIVPERLCPWDPSAINDSIGFEAVILAQGSLLHPRQWYTLDEEGDARILLVKSALSQGFPVGGAWRVMRGFHQNNPDLFLRKYGMTVYRHDHDAGFTGNHAMAIVAYQTIDGEDFFLVQNSWGTGFADGGRFFVEREYVEAAWDLSVVTF